jgi:formylglycine-generating enzyme
MRLSTSVSPGFTAGDKIDYSGSIVKSPLAEDQTVPTISAPSAAKVVLTLFALSLAPSTPAAASPAPPAGSYASVRGGEFRSVLPEAVAGAAAYVKPFALQRLPVTNAEYLEFVRAHPQWQRGKAPANLADGRYLEHWHGPLELGRPALAEQPVTHVSWFAARAYCESQQARLPAWIEWEFAAAADEHVADARHDPVWRQAILTSLVRPPGAPLPMVGLKAPNLYGIQDLHGLVWEWVENFDVLFMPRGPSAQEHAGMTMSPGDTAMSCGAAALSVSDPENYPMILRLAVLSSVNRASTTADLGFRCARSTDDRRQEERP